MAMLSDMGITDERLKLEREDVIALAPKLDKVHLFDTEKGEALA